MLSVLVLCSDVSLQCSPEDFWFINSCEVLGQHFVCEAGCTVEMGLDVPNFVSDPLHSMHGSCLVSQQQPRCMAHHNSTSRLCPCVQTHSPELPLEEHP